MNASGDLGGSEGLSPTLCDACKAASSNAGGHVCQVCGYAIAPKHYVENIKRSVSVTHDTFDVPFYPSGNPATGPTHYRSAASSRQHQTIEVRWGDGHVTNTSDAREAECDHCRRLRAVLPGAKQRVDEARKQGVSYAVPGYKLNEIAGWAVGFGFYPSPHP